MKVVTCCNGGEMAPSILESFFKTLLISVKLVDVFVPVVAEVSKDM